MSSSRCGTQNRPLLEVLKIALNQEKFFSARMYKGYRSKLGDICELEAEKCGGIGNDAVGVVSISHRHEGSAVGEDADGFFGGLQGEADERILEEVAKFSCLSKK